MSVTIGSWALPALITLVSAVWAFWPESSPTFGSAVANTICVLFAAVVSLASWLVWSLFA